MLRITSLVRLRSSLGPALSLRSLSLVNTAASDVDAKVVVAKYFNGSISTPIDPIKWKESVQAALSSRDNEQLNLLVKQSISSIDNDTLVDLLQYSIVHQNFTVSYELLIHCEEMEVVVPEVLCIALLRGAMDSFQYHVLYPLLCQMIRNGYTLPHNLVSNSLRRMLARNQSEVINALKLLQLMVEKKCFFRVDEAVTQATMNLPSGLHDSVQFSQTLRATYECILNALTEKGQISYRVTNLLSNIAASAGFAELSIDYSRKMIDVLVEWDQKDLADNPLRSITYDVLKHMINLVRLGAMHIGMKETNQPEKLSTLLLMNMWMENISKYQLKSENGIDSLYRSSVFYQEYFVLSHRCRHATLNADLCGRVFSTSVVDDVHERALKQYQALYTFVTDGKTPSKVFRVESGYNRRIFREMCYTLDLPHQMVSSSKDPNRLAVRVHMPEYIKEGLLMAPMSYLDTAKLRSSKFTGLPLYWKEIQAQHLQTMSEVALTDISVPLMLHMLKEDGVGVVSWALLWWEHMRSRDIPTPPRFVRALLVGAVRTHDVFALLEILHIVKLERARQLQEPAYFEKYKAVYERAAQSKVLEYEEAKNASIMSQIGNDVVELMQPSDWTLVFDGVNKNTSLVLDGKFYAATNDELMGLMQDMEVDLDTSAMSSLLRFLVRTKQQNYDMVLRVTEKLMEDQLHPLSMKECSSLSMFLFYETPLPLRYLRIVSSDNFSSYMKINVDQTAKLYLKVVDRLKYIESDPQMFDELWRNLKSSRQARQDMCQYLLDVLQRRDKSLTDVQYGSCYLLAQVATVTAYWLCRLDGEYRQAFHLLAEWSLFTAEMNVNNTFEQDKRRKD